MEGQEDIDDDDDDADKIGPIDAEKVESRGNEKARHVLAIASSASSAPSASRSRRAKLAWASVSVFVVLAATMLILLLLGVFRKSGAGGVSSTPGRGVRFTVPGSVCLDGGPMSVYVERKPTSRRWVIHLQGGGFCSGAASCTERMKTSLGSCARDVPVSDPWDELNYAILSNDPVNPFSSANKVLLRYCSGDLWSGNGGRVDATPSGPSMQSSSTPLRFFGHVNFARAMAFLRDMHGLHLADAVVLTGDSAGGAGVLYNVDVLQSMIPEVVVVGNPVGGTFPIRAVYAGPSSTAMAAEQLLDPRSVRAYLSLFNATTLLAPHEFARTEVLAPLYLQEYLTDFLTTSLYAGVPLAETPVSSADTSSGSGSAKLQWISTTGQVNVADDPQPLDIPEVHAYLEEYAEDVSTLVREIGARNSVRGPSGGTAASCYLHTNFDVTWPVVNGANSLDALDRWLNVVLDGASAAAAAASATTLSPGPADVADGGRTGVFVNVDGCGPPYYPPCNPTCPRDAG